MNIMHRILRLAAEKTLVIENVEPKVKAERLGVCDGGCGFLNKASRKCRGCGCYVDAKAGSKENWNPVQNRFEITHCPKGKWNDKELANQYRALDGLKPLK